MPVGPSCRLSHSLPPPSPPHFPLYFSTTTAHWQRIDARPRHIQSRTGQDMAVAIQAKQRSSCDLRLRRTESLPLCCATSPATTLSSLFFFFFYISCLPFFPFCSGGPSRTRTKRSGQRNGGIIYLARRCMRLRCTSKVKVRYGRVKRPYSLSAFHSLSLLLLLSSVR